MDITVSRIPQDGRFTLKMENREINVRVSTMPTIYGENVVMRLLDMSSGVYSLDRLGMIKTDRDKIETMVRKAYGMILSTGPTGSGKSTSLYSILNELNQTRHEHHHPRRPGGIPDRRTSARSSSTGRRE